MARGAFSGTQRIGVPLPLANLTTFTIFTWVWIGASQAANNRVYEMGDGTHGVGLGFQLAGTNMQVLDNGIAWRGAGVVLSTGLWYAHGLTRSGGGNYQVYVNGTNTENPTAAPAGFVGGNQLTIGNNIGATLSLNGVVGPFSVWNAALSANDHLQLARGAPPMSVAPYSALQLHLPMLGAGGASAHENDWSVNQRLGTQVGNVPVQTNTNVSRPLPTP